MPDVKISELDAAAALTGAELLEVVQSGANVQTTAADLAALASGGGFRAVAEETGTTYTALAADKTKWLRLTNASAITLTINASVHAAGDELVFEQGGAGQVTVAAGSGMTLRARGGANKSAGQYGVFMVKFLTATEFLITGDVTA